MPFSSWNLTCVNICYPDLVINDICFPEETSSKVVFFIFKLFSKILEPLLTNNIEGHSILNSSKERLYIFLVQQNSFIVFFLLPKRNLQILSKGSSFLSVCFPKCKYWLLNKHNVYSVGTYLSNISGVYYSASVLSCFSTIHLTFLPLKS